MCIVFAAFTDTTCLATDTIQNQHTSLLACASNNIANANSLVYNINDTVKLLQLKLVYIMAYIPHGSQASLQPTLGFGNCPPAKLAFNQKTAAVVVFDKLSVKCQ